MKIYRVILDLPQGRQKDADIPAEGGHIRDGAYQFYVGSLDNLVAAFGVDTVIGFWEVKSAE